MVKSSKAKKPSNLGKGKVTPVQIAFIVERFLFDNNYKSTLAAFRSEASDLFSKTKAKEVPKGLLGLADILDEYISLKEQKMIVDQEKRRVEFAFQGLQDVMRAYNSPQPLPPLPPQVAMTPNGNGALYPVPNPNDASPSQGPLIHGSFVNIPQQPLLLHKVEETHKFSTPIPNYPLSRKRKSLSSVPKAPPSPKKCCAGSTSNSHLIEGKGPSANTTQINIEHNVIDKTTSTRSTRRSLVEGSSIAKSLFKNTPGSRANSTSPKTPPRALHCQNDESVSSIGHSHIDAGGTCSSQKIGPSSCAIISSETIVISPLKHKGYYSVDRSYHVSASPLRSGPEKMNKREQVKGRLDFDESCAQQSSEEQVAIESSPSTADGEASGSFDFDLPDFDFFDGDFSKLLGDIDLDGEQVHCCQQSSVPAGFNLGLRQNVGGECSGANEALPNPCMSTVTEIVSQKDINIQGLETMTTMRSITKRVMISSPSKGSGNCSAEPTDSQSK